MRISDWSSDVCSSDLAEKDPANGGIFHIVDPDHITQQEYLAHAAKHFGGKPRITRVPQWLFMTLATALEALGKVIGRYMPLTRYRVRSLRPLADVDVSRAEAGLGWKLTVRSDEHTAELQSVMRVSYGVFCFKQEEFSPKNRQSAHPSDH